MLACVQLIKIKFMTSKFIIVSKTVRALLIPCQRKYIFGDISTKSLIFLRCQKTYFKTLEEKKIQSKSYLSIPLIK